MTVEKYLKQFGPLRKEITLNCALLQILYAIWELIAPTPQETQAVRGTDTLEALDASFKAVEYQYATEIIRQLQLWLDIQLTINSLDDSTQRIVLTEKYINLKQPDDIAVEIPCDVRTVYMWLNDAIAALQAQHPDMFEAAGE